MVLTSILSNPSLLEHETFTDLLQAVFHLEEELGKRFDVENLSESDKEHIAGDIVRVYKHLVLEWINYMRYIKREYPFLYTFAVETNPFRPKP